MIWNMQEWVDMGSSGLECVGINSNWVRRARNVLEPVELGWNELDWVGMGLV